MEVTGAVRTVLSTDASRLTHGSAVALVLLVVSEEGWMDGMEKFDVRAMCRRRAWVAQLVSASVS